MKMFKKNQLVILVISLMLVTIGYLNYTSNESLMTSANTVDLAAIGDARLVSSNAVVENEIVEDNQIEVEETVNQILGDSYFSNSRLDRDNMYSQMIENYQELIENANVSQEQKAIAVEEIKRINETKNAIMICENLIKTKGFEDCIVFINEQSVSVVIKKNALETEDIAQIQNIVSREIKAELNNINITNKR